MSSMKLWTKKLTGTLEIAEAMGVQILSFKVTGTGATIYGNEKLWDSVNSVAIDSDAIPLADGDSQFITAPPGSFIDGVTITPNAATVYIEIFF